MGVVFSLDAYVFEEDWDFGYETGRIARSLATGEGFSVTFATGFGSGDAISDSGPYTTADGSEWAQAMPAGTSVGSWATSGSSIFAATGTWVVELNEDGDVASEFFKQDGAWLIGTTSS